MRMCVASLCVVLNKLFNQQRPNDLKEISLYRQEIRLHKNKNANTNTIYRLRLISFYALSMQTCHQKSSITCYLLLSNRQTGNAISIITIALGANSYPSLFENQ